jgi:translation initiation factor 1
MANKNKPDKKGFVYSTDPNFRFEEEDTREQETLIPGQQKLKLRLDTKQRAGKAVTLVEGFTGTVADLEDLGKKLKTFCGTGGSVKDRWIIIQGDQREKIMQWLIKNGYSKTKKM